MGKKRKSSGVGEFAGTGALMKMSRNPKIQGAGSTMIFVSIILLIGQLIKLCFVIPYQICVWSIKFTIWLLKQTAIILKLLFNGIVYLGNKFKEYNKKNKAKKTLD